MYGPLCFGAGLVALISLVGYGLSHAARRIPAGAKPADSINPGQRIALALLGVEFFIAAMFALVGLLPLTGSPGLAPVLMLAGGVIACVILLLRWQSQGLGASASLAHPGDGTPDACWKLGLFYYNPEDAALFVEKRIGFGYTINFARPAAWVMLVLTLLVPLALAALTIPRQHR